MRSILNQIDLKKLNGLWSAGFFSKQHKQHFFLELSGMFNCGAYNVTETSQHILVVVSYLGHGSHTHGRLDHEPIFVSLLSRFDLEQKKQKKCGKIMIFFNFVSRYLHG